MAGNGDAHDDDQYADAKVPNALACVLWVDEARDPLFLGLLAVVTNVIEVVLLRVTLL